MDEDLTALKSSIIDRATALGAYISALQADSARSDEGFSRALEICVGYTRAFVAQLKVDWHESSGRERRLTLLSAALGSFLLREWWIDQRFARSAQRDVPRALKTIARAEFRDHGLDSHEPVLTVGPPDSFETHQASLAQFLFKDIYIRLDGPELDGLEELRHGGSALSVFSAPYIEGTRVLWYPIVLGHEIAHVRLDNGKGARPIDEIVREWFLSLGSDYSAAADEVVDGPERNLIARPTLERQMVDWVTEVICDLNTACRFGPAGVSAIAEFLATLEFHPGAYALNTTTHPPLWTRLQILFRALERWGWLEGSTLPEYAAVWLKRTERPETPFSARVAFGVTRLLQQGTVERLIDLVEEWAPPYAPAKAQPRIQMICEELLDGVPGVTHAADGQGAADLVSIADVVNATWVARHALASADAGDRSTAAGVLLNCDLDAHAKRVRLDSLASKAIDTLEVARLLGASEDHGVTSVDALDGGADASGGSPAGELPTGVLSRPTLARRLKESGRSRIVITPLFGDSVQDAAIDLRLGPDFIAFRHSAIEAFNPLESTDSDPRTMQERVHKGWGEPFVLHPQELVLASTLEYLVLPDDVAAQVLTRSSYGRLGLLTATAVQVQPGSRGCITLELVNQGETPIRLAPGARVAQLMLWTVTSPVEPERGKYWFPVGPEFSKVAEDKDRETLTALADAANSPAAQERPPFTARYDSTAGEAEEFYRVARAQGAADVPPPEQRRLGALGVSEVILGVTVSISILSTTLQRWLQARERGVVVSLAEGEIVTRPDKNLPRGTVAFTGPDGLVVKQLELPPDDRSDIAEVLRRLLASHAG